MKVSCELEQYDYSRVSTKPRVKIISCDDTWVYVQIGDGEPARVPGPELINAIKNALNCK